MTTTPEIPTDFWGQIGHQLDRIAAQRPTDFAAVRAILLDPAYDEITSYVHQNGEVVFTENQAFFAGTGGDRSVTMALLNIGWNIVHSDDQYSYTLSNPPAGKHHELVEYCEGDLTLVARDDRPLGPTTTAGLNTR